MNQIETPLRRPAGRGVGLVEDERQADQVAFDELDLDDLFGAGHDDVHVGVEAGAAHGFRARSAM